MVCIQAQKWPVFKRTICLYAKEKIGLYFKICFKTSRIGLYLELQYGMYFNLGSYGMKVDIYFSMWVTSVQDMHNLGYQAGKRRSHFNNRFYLNLMCNS